MLLVGQRVDDAEPRRRCGERLQPRLRVGADDGAVDPALEVARDVGDRLALAEHFLARRLDHVAAELAHGDLEGRARAQRRLLEQQREVRPGERLLVRHAGGARRLELAASRRQACSSSCVRSSIERNLVIVAVRPGVPISPLRSTSTRALGARRSSRGRWPDRFDREPLTRTVAS